MIEPLKLDYLDITADYEAREKINEVIADLNRIKKMFEAETE